MRDGWIGVTGLMRLAISGELRANERAVLARGDSGQIVGIASAHGVLPLLAHAAEHPAASDLLEPGLAEFLAGIRASNIARNRMLHSHLADIGSAFDKAGIEGVILKGGNELLTPIYPSGGRFIGDLDILVPVDRIEAARSVFQRLGYASSDDRDDPALHHHLPALQHSTTHVWLELHRRLATGRGDKVLPASLVLATARAAPLPGLRVPADWIRLLHVIVHAQNSAAADAPNHLRLRDLSEILLIARNLGNGDWRHAREQAACGGMQLAFDGMVETSHHLLANPRPNSRTVATWIKLAVSSLGTPDIRRRSYVRERLTYYARKLIGDAQARRRYIGHLLRPRHVLRAMRQHLAEFQNIR